MVNGQKSTLDHQGDWTAWSSTLGPVCVTAIRTLINVIRIAFNGKRTIFFSQTLNVSLEIQSYTQ